MPSAHVRRGRALTKRAFAAYLQARAAWVAAVRDLQARKWGDRPAGSCNDDDDDLLIGLSDRDDDDVAYYEIITDYDEPAAAVTSAGHPSAFASPLLTSLASLTPEDQKNELGERLYILIQRVDPAQAAKLTGMFLEMENADIVDLLNSPDALREKIKEAQDVLTGHRGNAET